MIIIYIALIFLLIGLNAFFVAAEYAATVARRSRVENVISLENQTARLVASWLEKPSQRDRLITASQLGITLATLALGITGQQISEYILVPYLQNAILPGGLSFVRIIYPALPLILNLVFVACLHVVLGEQVPKAAILRSPEQFMVNAAPVLRVFLGFFRPFVDFLNWASKRVLQFGEFPTDSEHGSIYTPEEIKELVLNPQIEEVIKEPEKEMLTAVIDFGSLIVRQVSIPRTEIVAVEAKTPIEDILHTAMSDAKTKIPVYEDNLDTIVGIVHLRDLIRAVEEEKGNLTAYDLSREALFVPETISVYDLLQQFRASHMHIAIVLDEFGGTAGLVTLEDLMEEIVGEVQDPFEYETEPPNIQMQSDGTFLIKGMTNLEEVNEQLVLTLSDPDYDTIAGFILGKLGRIARVGDMVVDTENAIRLKVEKMDKMRIEQVSMHKL